MIILAGKDKSQSQSVMPTRKSPRKRVNIQLFGSTNFGKQPATAQHAPDGNAFTSAESGKLIYQLI